MIRAFPLDHQYVTYIILAKIDQGPPEWTNEWSHVSKPTQK